MSLAYLSLALAHLCGLGHPCDVPSRITTGTRLLKQVKPQYPLDAVRQGLSGTVFVRAVVNFDGTTFDATVARSVHPLLDQAALDAVLQWRFEPPQIRGSPVCVRLEVKFAFELEPTASRTSAPVDPDDASPGTPLRSDPPDWPPRQSCASPPSSETPPPADGGP